MNAISTVLLTNGHQLLRCQNSIRFTHRRFARLTDEEIDLGTIQVNVDSSVIDLELTNNFSSFIAKTEDSSWKWLQYGAKVGSLRFRVALSDFITSETKGLYSDYDSSVKPEHLLLTSGASSTVHLASSLLMAHSSNNLIVFVEDPTYFLSLGIFRDLKVNIIGMKTDSSGLIVDDEFERLLATHKPSIIYTIPSFNNPTGSILTIERRKRLVELARKYSAYILADEVYQLLHFGEAPPPSLTCFDNSENPRVLSIGSFSKILGPGLRVGWIQAHPSIISKISNSGVLNSGGALNHFASAIVCASLENGFQAKHIQLLKSTYKERAVNLYNLLEEHLPKDQVVSISRPTGGYFVWVEMKDAIDKNREDKMLSNGVRIRNGKMFSPTGSFSNCMRLSFAYYDKKDTLEGVKRLGRSFTIPAS